MLRTVVRAGVLALSLSIAACGGGSDDGPSGLPKPAQVSITTQIAELFVGQSLQLSATALDASGAEMAAGDATWSSANPAIAQVTETGMLMAMAPGPVTLRATIAGVSATVNVTVEALPPYDVTIQVAGTFAPASFAVRRSGTVRFVFSGMQQNITFSRAFAGAPADVPNTSTGTVTRQFNTVGDFRFESTITPGLAGFVRVR
jgi:hypothetical protein